MLWKLLAVMALLAGVPAWAQGGSIPPTSTILALKSTLSALIFQGFLVENAPQTIPLSGIV